MPRGLLFNYENGAPKVLSSLSTVLLQRSCQEIIRLLIRDNKTPVKRL